MKTLRFLVSGLLVTTAVCQAQITTPGLFRAGNRALPILSRSGFTTQSRAQSEGQFLLPQVQTGVPGIPVAEAITPEIQALADGLQDNPTNIFNYVHDHIRFVLYYGSKKGAELTLLERSGNDFDQSALLVALLRAAGYTNVQYQFGWQLIPYDDPSGQNHDLHHWWQLTFDNTNWLTTVTNFFYLVGDRGYPKAYYFLDGNTFDIQRTWVALTIGSTTYQLDPAFKISLPVTGMSLTNAMGGTGTTISNALSSAAAGADTGNYTQGLNEANMRGKLTTYTTNLFNCIRTNAPNASVEEVLGGWQIVPAYGPSDFSGETQFPTDDYGGSMPVLSWANEPTNMMSTLTITFAGTNYHWFMPQLQGQRLALVFDGGGTVRLWQDDALLAQRATSGPGDTTNVALAVTHPIGYWDTTNNVFIPDPTNLANMTAINSYRRTNAIYAILYAFEPDWGWLKQRQNKLGNYLQQGLGGDSRQVLSETLNIMGLTWMLETAQTEQILAAQLGILPQWYHRLGRMAQETGHGYYVDVYMQLTCQMPSGNYDAAHIRASNVHFDMFSFFGSALEHGIIEQLQNSNLVAASTVKMLQIANTNGQPIYLASNTNWTTDFNVRSHLVNYDSGTLSDVGSFISHGFYVLMPSNGLNHVSSEAGSWAGYGYEARQATNGVPTYAAMIIAGGYNGGFVGDKDANADGGFIFSSGQSQPSFHTPTEAFTQGANNTIGDPVDAVNGTFQVENSDLSLGQAEPRGITLSRYYNGTRRFENPAGMAGGWIHNYAMTANNIAAPQAGLGGTTPAQAASMFAATAAAIATYNGGYPNPKNWMVTALIAKWGVDQLTKNGVSINLGKDTIQFVQQPNGVFTPPANCTMTLSQNGSSYTLQQRRANKFNFDSQGRLTSIADPYNQMLNVTYSASNWVSTVKDWKNRQLTFNYSGTPSRLTSVTDNITPARTVSYVYSTAYNAQGDLTSFTDAEGQTSTYVYDNNHQIIATFDALNQMVVSNLYDSQGHVTTQYTQGDMDKMWRIFWSGWQTTEIDPANGRTDYFYDDQGRQTAMVDPLNYETDTCYDGQNHIIQTVSPLLETNQYLYDGSNNLVQTIDPLGFTNRFVYDSLNNLIRTIDPCGNTNRFGYNSQFSLTGRTNGAGDWVQYTYNSDGTLNQRIDPGGTTTYGYESTYRQLISITYPNSLGVDNFANNPRGDATNHVNARGFATGFRYDSRRQLTNTIAPTNVITRTTYDANGNVASTTDPRGNVSSNLWSATRHLLAAYLPPTPQGVPVVTNIYDSRDWLVRSLDPLQQPTLYTNNAKGRLISQTDPLLRTTRFTYDADGRKLTAANAANETNRQTWDKRGSLIQLADGAGHTSLRAYNGAGNQVLLTNRNGKVWQFQFDGANRLTNTVTPMNRQTMLAYDNRGLLRTAREPSGQIATNWYDAKGRLATNWMSGMAAIYYKHDLNDNVTNVVENGKTNVWAYDAYDRVVSYRDAYTNLIRYRYDLNGNLTNLIYPGNRNVYYAYDSLNHLTNVTDWAGRKTSITYDLAGRMTGLTRPNGTQRIIGYDAAGQATNILEQTAAGVPIALFHFNWNAAAEMQWEFAAPLPHNNAVPTRTMTYDDDNRLATVNGQNVTVDADGNLTSGPLTNDTFATYTYDARNRLVSAGGLGCTYDGSGNRIAMTNGATVTKYVINPNARLSQVLMRIQNGVTNYYIYGAGLLYEVTETATTTNVLTYHYDYRGSTVALTDTNGNVTDRMEYSAYATMTYRSGTNDTPFLFNGRYGVMTDPNGLLYMRARYYNPYLCRFLNPDPSGFAGGLNFFTYANGNPISYLDPFGQYALVDDLAFMGAGAVIGVVGQGVADLVKWHWSGWTEYGYSAAAGVAGGEATLYGTPIAGGAAFMAAKNTLDQSKQLAATGGDFSFTELGLNTGIGAATGGAARFVPLPAVAGLNAGQGSFDAVTAQMITKLENGTIQNLTWSTGGKMFVSEAYSELAGVPLDTISEGLQWNLYGDPATGISPVWNFSSFNQSPSAGRASVDWLGNTISSSSTGKPH